LKLDKSIDRLSERLEAIESQDSTDKNQIDPEQESRERYQYFKYENWFFHKSSWYMRGVNGYDGKGCNNGVCVPECKFFHSEGKLYEGEGFD
jgi:hypothetical protein